MRSVFLERPATAQSKGLGHARSFILAWGPAILGMAVIATESTPTFSAANTSSWLRPIAERLVGPIGTPAWEQFHHLLRKSGHFLGYGTLCVLFLRGWLLSLARDQALSTSAWRLRSWACAVGSTFLVASADEWHQTFLPSRTGMFSDVVLDTLGGMLVSGLVLGLCWSLRRRALYSELENGYVD